ncbi:hypothetical protein IV79_GL000841 [Pediococcus claussenii]|nr:hypothetical protein IV79_GL000841 [Pediococcus claussenii]
MDLRMSLFDGTISQNDIAFHKSRSKGVGMDVVGSAFVSKNGNTVTGSVGVDNDGKIEGLNDLANTIHANDTKAILQLVHAGRMTNRINTFGEQVMAPSSIKGNYGTLDVPREMTRMNILKVVNDFSTATKRAMAAKFDGIEIHGANGFLPQQFVSPLSNKRCDQFGGSIENRLRFIEILIRSLSSTISQFDQGKFLLGYRLSPEEFETGGMTIRDTILLVKLLNTLNIDYISLSLHDFKSVPKTYQSNFSILEIFKAITKIPIIASGKIRNVVDTNLALQNSDLIAVGTPLIASPNWAPELTGVANTSKKMQSAFEIGISEDIYKFLR